MKVVSVILARGGSKGIPKKNIIDVNGIPLIAYTIQASLQSNSEETWVCTDCEEIAEVSKKYGAQVLMRPSALATDSSKSEESLLFFAENIDFDYLIFIQATSPLLTSNYINQGIEMIASQKYDSVFTAYKEHWIPRWGKEVKPHQWNPEDRPMRQDKDELWVENGAFYITKKSLLLESKLRYCGKIGVVEMPMLQSFQVDTLEDLELIKKIL